MNVEKIKGLIEVLKVVEENDPDSFNMEIMGDYLIFDEVPKKENIFACEAPACIAGWTCAVYELSLIHI